MSKKLLRAALGEKQQSPPIWIMRQAGRYLPEYRKVRQEVGDFLELCYSPELACEVTLQPLRRFDLDAAILFSDILVVPDALGQKVWFEQGEGPRLNPITSEQIEQLSVERAKEYLQPVLQTVANIRKNISDEKSLIGFCGSPWTVATYMIAGKGSPDQAAARLFALEQPAAFTKLIDILVAASIEYLVAQFRQGADLVQLFESWAANLDEISFKNYVVEPNRRIVEGVRTQIPNAAIIGFPRGGGFQIKNYVQQTKVNALGIDYAMPLEQANALIDQDICLQGNLDPLRLVAGGKQMEDRVREILTAFKHRPHIFNLGHGIVPQTPIEHVQHLIELVKGGDTK